MKSYASLNHTRWDCKYHVVFIPKRRKKQIYGSIRRSVAHAGITPALMFQSTPPRGGRRRDDLSWAMVSIHARAGGDHGIRHRFQSTPPRGGRPRQRSFNPRPRAGGDMSVSCETRVSIHAPARGATEMPMDEFDPCRGATLQCFNPRPRAGGDQVDAGRLMVSISFNPRPRAGGD